MAHAGFLAIGIPLLVLVGTLYPSGESARRKDFRFDSCKISLAHLGVILFCRFWTS
jgi:hypothetical protein